MQPLRQATSATARLPLWLAVQAANSARQPTTYRLAGRSCLSCPHQQPGSAQHPDRRTTRAGACRTGKPTRRARSLGPRSPTSSHGLPRSELPRPANRTGNIPRRPPEERGTTRMSELLKHPGESQNDTPLTRGQGCRAHPPHLSLQAGGWPECCSRRGARRPVDRLPARSRDEEGQRHRLVDQPGRTSRIFQKERPRLADFISPVKALGDGQTAKLACWVRHISGDEFQIFAINCAHLGCPVHWFAQSKLFLCPCHGGTYYETGERASGPPERGLFEYRFKVVGDSLVIHAGDMPTLATHASCGKKPLVNITPATANARSPWQA